MNRLCKHFGSCGGCSFQHVSYEDQLAEKQQKIRDLFCDFDVEILPIIACQDAWRYRNKMEFSFSQDKAGKKFLGLILCNSKGRVLDVEECLIAPEWMVDALKECRAWWHASSLEAYHPFKNSGSLRTLTLRNSLSTGDRVVVLLVSANPDYSMKRWELEEFTQRMQKAVSPTSIVLRLQQVMKGKPTQFYEMLLAGRDFFCERVTVFGKTFEFQVSPSSFFQPNSLQSNTLYSTAIGFAGLQKDEVLYDLYAGIGVFGMCAASQVRKVVSIEISPDSAYDATINVQKLALENVELFRGDVAEILKQKKFPQADVLIVDPPRCGLGEKAIIQIAELRPKRIVYVSCNPKTQSQDAQILCRLGFSLRRMQPLDQFPHTPHMENIALFTRHE
jgi:23S rRNA (uracil1939-C5)-methyltransferase